ncbi:MAG: hypothetical protein IK115_13445 [Lachnospiraceae bacterium]|nr:hypothetical protein [Lachnospiraceae bacterium]
MRLSKLTENLGLKLLALLVAFALWLIVINYADPMDTTSYSGVKVEIVNSDSLTAKGMCYEVLNHSDVVDVEIRAKRSVLDSLSYENIRAVADMENLSYMNTVTIQVYANKSNDQLDSIRQSREQMELSVENLKEVPMTVFVDTLGEPAEGYVMGNVTQTQNSVRVSGPESVVDTIAWANCSVSVAGRNSDLSTSADIRLVDGNGDIVTHENLKTNISTINVGVEILPTKAVDVIYNVSGEPAEGYVVSGEPVADRTAIYIAARNSVLNGISSISVPGSELNVEGEESSVTKELNLEDYLPDGVHLVMRDGFYGPVNVTVKIEELVSHSFSVPMRNLTAVGVPEGFEAEIFLMATEEDDGEAHRVANLRITLNGVEDDFTDVKGSDILGEIRVDDFLAANQMENPVEGYYQMPIVLTLPDGLDTEEIYYADVHLKPKAEETE